VKTQKKNIDSLKHNIAPQTYSIYYCFRIENTTYKLDTTNAVPSGTSSHATIATVRYFSALHERK